MAGAARIEAAAVAVMVAAVALAVRWHSPHDGRALRPRPDALEYVAGAQSIAQAGQYLLQIGPHRERPLYPPGYPLLLGGALALGMPVQSLPRLGALAGAGLAALAALAAASAVRRTAALAGRDPGAAPVRCAIAASALAAGMAWAVAPVAVALGRLVMSDEPAALVTVAAALLVGRWLLGEGRPLQALAGGGLWGLLAAMRPIGGGLLAVPVAVLVVCSLRERGFGATVRRALPLAAGGLAVPALVMLLLARSDLSPLEWSGYRLWVPHRFASLDTTFQLRFALQPARAFRAAAEGDPMSNLELGARVLLGLPMRSSGAGAGLLWPLAGWLGGVALWRASRPAAGGRRRASAAAAAVTSWVLAHLVTFALYFFPAARFYLPVLAVAAILFGAACGLGVLACGRRWRWGAAGVAVLVAAVAGTSWPDIRPRSREPFRPPPLERMVARRVAQWLALGDAARAGATLPFDPVYAQAMGLLRPSRIASVREWGRLPSTRHTRAMLQQGRLPSHAVAPPEEGPASRRRRRGAIGERPP